nr:hypothetical protein [uncultured Rhodopila sp.]
MAVRFVLTLTAREAENSDLREGSFETVGNNIQKIWFRADGCVLKVFPSPLKSREDTFTTLVFDVPAHKVTATVTHNGETTTPFKEDLTGFFEPAAAEKRATRS